jgi:hypothetical protein
LEEIMRRHVAIIGMALVAIGIAPARADGDGLPVTGVDAGPAGVTTPGAAARFVTIAAGRDTVVARIRRQGGQVTGSRVLHGSFTVPAVALDGSPAGLSADRRTLVLIRPRPGFPRARTRFAVLDARRLALREAFTLAGDFSFDALSPDGSRLYLIQYTSRRDPTHYRVRAYDLRRGRMLRAPIVDPREPDEQMRGYPITRSTSVDGRWAYTLYDGGAAHPFVHALDTSRGEAACIDLDDLAGRQDLGSLRLTLGGGGKELTVRDPLGDPVAIIDRTTFGVRAPAAEPHRRPARAAAPRAGGDGPPWTLIASAAAALLLAAGAGLTARRRNRGEAIAPLDAADPELEREEARALR